MSWFKLTDDERKEWRNHPTTASFIEALKDQIADAKDDIVTTMTAEDDQAQHRARRMAGRVDGLEVAIKIIGADK